MADLQEEEVQFLLELSKHEFLRCGMDVRPKVNSLKKNGLLRISGIAMPEVLGPDGMDSPFVVVTITDLGRKFLVERERSDGCR